MQTNFEPPLPGVASQAGSNSKHYAALLQTAEQLLNVVGGIDACALDAHHELSGDPKKASEVVTAVRDAISIVLASSAAVCSDLSVALRHMPLWGPCSGPKISWRPKSDAFWQDSRDHLQAAADGLSSLLGSVNSDGAAEGSLAPARAFLQGRAILAMLASCDILIANVISLENEAATALKLQVPSLTSSPKEGPHEPNSDLLGEERKPSSLKENFLNSGYAPSVTTLFLMGLGVPVWIALLKATVSLVTGTWTFIRVPASRIPTMKDRNVQ